jgi:hypothetical protein
MPYTPINTPVFTAAFAGAIGGMATSGWIIDQTSADYTNVTLVAGAFAQSFDQVWNNAATLNNLELAAITSIVQTDFNGRGPGPYGTTLQDPANWRIAAGACAALILESDIYFASQGINPGSVVTLTNLSNALYVDSGTVVPGPTQNGNIETPFATLTSGITATQPLVSAIIITPGTYSAEALIVLPHDALAIVKATLDDDQFVPEVLLPAIDGLTNSSTLMLQGVSPQGPITAGSLMLTGCNTAVAATLTSNGDVIANDSTLRGAITASGVFNAKGCILLGSVDTISGIILADCDFAGPVVFTNTGVATIVMDGRTYARFLSSGSSVVSLTIIVEEAIPKLLVDLDGQDHAISNFHNGGSTVNLVLGADGLQSFPAFVIPGLPINSKFSVTYGFRGGMYIDGTPADNGEMEFIVGASISTDGTGVATVTFNSPRTANLALLPASLSGTDFTADATTGGFTAKIQRPPGVACHAWYEFWFQRYRQVP